MTECVTCSRCSGRGRVSFSEEFPRHNWALEILRKQGPHSAAELYALCPERSHITINAMNNRLEDLRRLGFATRSKRGRQWIYAATTTNA